MKKHELAVVNEAQRAVITQSRKKKMRIGAVSTVTIVLVIAVAILLNLVLQVLDNHFDLSVDFSQIQVTEIDEYSVEYINALSHNIEIIVNGNEQEYKTASYDNNTDEDSGISYNTFSAKRYTYELLKSFAAHTDKITVQYIETRYNPQFFKERNITLEEDTFLTVYCPETKRSFQISESVFDEDEYVGLERRVDGAMEYVGTDDLKTIAFITGHDETIPAYFVDMLQMNAYNVVKCDTTMLTSISSAADLLIIIDPQVDFTATEIKALRAFLNNDGEFQKSLMVFMDADTPSLPRFENFLAEWGISYTTTTVFDRANSSTILDDEDTGTGVASLRLKYASNAMSADVADSLYDTSDRIRVRLGKTRAIDILPLSDGKQTGALLTTAGSAAFGVDYSTKVIDSTNWADIKMEDDDAIGPFNIGVMTYIGDSERVDKTAGYTYYTEYSYVAAFGTDSLVDSYFLSNLTAGTSATAPYMLSLIRYMTGRDSYIFIYSTSFISGIMTFENDTIVRIVSILIIGLVPVICGVFTVVRGRKRKYL